MQINSCANRLAADNRDYIYAFFKFITVYYKSRTSIGAMLEKIN